MDLLSFLRFHFAINENMLFTKAEHLSHESIATAYPDTEVYLTVRYVRLLEIHFPKKVDHHRLVGDSLIPRLILGEAMGNARSIAGLN